MILSQKAYRAKLVYLCALFLTLLLPLATLADCGQAAPPLYESLNDATYQKMKDFFNARGLVLQLSKLRTYLSFQAKAGTVARLLQTTFVIHQYKGRTFYAPA